jgi:hypothetical protein
MMNGGMMDGMGSMMGWMMGLGLLGWVLVIALFATIAVLLVQVLRRSGGNERRGTRPPDQGPGEARG